MTACSAIRKKWPWHAYYKWKANSLENISLWKSYPNNNELNKEKLSNFVQSFEQFFIYKIL